MASPRKAGSASKSKLNLSERECELLAAAWLSSQNPQIDWNKFVDLAGFKNANSARACFGPLRKKLQDQYGGGQTGGTEIAAKQPSEKKPRTPKKRGSEAIGDGSGNSNDSNSDVLQSPSKKPKANPKPKMEVEDDEEGLV